MRDSYLVFGQPDIQQADIDAVTDVMRSKWIGTGPVARQFEQEFAKYVNADHAVAVGSCTAALHLAMLCLDLPTDARVIVPALTFVASANAVVHAGATPVFCDVDIRTQCATANTIRQAMGTDHVEAIMVVHFAGRPCDNMPDICFLADTADTDYARAWLVEDCAHSIEANVGHYGDVAAFSFYATKNMTTGEGGMLVTNDPDTAECVRTLALHGMSADAWKRFSDDGYKHYDLVEPGFKYNMTDMQAALGMSQFIRLENNLKRREQIWGWYDDAFADLDCELPAAPAPGSRHARHLYTIMVDNRDDVMADLHKLNIGTGVHYRPVHLHDFYRREYGYERGMLPNAEWIGDHTLSLPLSPAMTNKDCADVIYAVSLVLA